MAGRPNDGCCTLGAHFSDKADRKRVEKWVNRLTPELWQNFVPGQDGWVMKDDDGDKQTRTYGGGCIFLNSPDFEGGGGCALHNLAVAKGVKPLRSSQTCVGNCRFDELSRSVRTRTGRNCPSSSLANLTAAGGAPVGNDLNWYCSGNPAAHVGPDPVYVSERDTLTELMGASAYGVLVGHCEEHLAAVSALGANRHATRAGLAVHQPTRDSSAGNRAG